MIFGKQLEKPIIVWKSNKSSQWEIIFSNLKSKNILATWLLMASTTSSLSKFKGKATSHGQLF